MPRSSVPYPYIIPPIDLTRARQKVRPQEAHEFLLIESLLRTTEMIDLYKRDKAGFNSYWKHNHGIFSRDPLCGSHHALIIDDRHLEEELLKFGYLDVGLGILDLGRFSRLQPGKELRYGPVVLGGPLDGGAKACALLLRSQDSKFLHLRLDLSHPPEAILERLRVLLHQKWKHAGDVGTQGVSGRLKPEAVAIKKIETRLKYLRCYDLQREGKKVEEIADIMYKGLDNSLGNASQALHRAKELIRSAEDSRTIKFLLAQSVPPLV